MSPRPRTTHRRREEIAAAALEVISERGFHDTRISDIAERAGTSAPAVLYHFDSKDEILDAAVSLAEDRFYAEVDAAVQAPLEPAQRIVRLMALGGCDDLTRTVAMWQVWMEIWTRALHERHTARTRRLLDRRWRATIAATIREGCARGDFPDTLDASQIALQLASLMDGLAVQFALGDPEVTGEVMTTVLLATAEQALGCELPRPERHGAAV